MSDLWIPGDPIPEDMLEGATLSWITDRVAICPFAIAASPGLLDDYEELGNGDHIMWIISIGETCPEDQERYNFHMPEIQDGTYELLDEHIAFLVCEIHYALIRKGERTVVHCTEGTSRSPAFVALGIALEWGWSWEDAKEHVVDARPETAIHPELERRLVDWLNAFRSSLESDDWLTALKKVRNF